MLRFVLFFAALALGFVSPRIAQAQHDVRWIVVSSAPADKQEQTTETMNLLGAALRESRAPALSPSDAAHLFEERSSRAARSMSSDEIATLATSVQNLELYVATSRREAALREAQRIQSLTSGAIDTLVQQRDVGSRLFAACLAVARLYLQSGDRDAARSEMFRCRQLGPDIEIDRRSQPPNVMTLLDDIDGEIRSRPTRTLRINTQAAGCDVLLNGRRVAVTPNPIRGVPMGEHRVEIACDDGRHSRFHRILLGSDDRTMSIDLDFDAAISTTSYIALAYPDAATENRDRIRFSETIANVLDATDVLLVTPEDNGIVRIDRIQPEPGRVQATVRVSQGLPVATYIEVLSALRSGTSLDFSNGQRAPLARWQPSTEAITSARQSRAPAEQSLVEAPAYAEEEEQAQSQEPTQEALPPEAFNPVANWQGWLFGAVGFGSIGAAIGVTVARERLQYLVTAAEPTDKDYRDRIITRDRLNVWPFALSAAGTIFSTIAMPYLLPEEEGIPWWSWLVGGVGVAGAVTGGLLYTLLPDCNDACPQPSLKLGHAVVAWGASVPLIAVPIIHAIRLATHDDAATVNATVTADQFTLTWQGSF